MPIRVPVVQTGLEASIQAAAKKAGRGMKVNMGAGAKSIDGLSQPLGRITGKADQFTKSMEAANARVLAFGASVGVLSAVTRGFKELVKTTIEVEKALTNINSILNVSASRLDNFKKTIFDVARSTEQSFATVADAALELSRQGLKAEEVTKRLGDAMILSRLSGLGAAEAVAGLTAAINSFNREGVTSEEVLNKLSAAAVKAAVSERDLIEGLKRSSSVAVQAGVSLDELVGVITAVQQKTARGGAVIGNSFKTIFTRIQSLEKLKTMQNLGVQVTDLQGEVLSGTKLIENLANTIKSLPDARKLQIAEGLVGKFQVAPFLAILDDYSQKTSTAIKITGVSQQATHEAYTRNIALNQTLSAALNETVLNVKELANTLGEIGVTENLQNVLGFFSSLVEKVKGVMEGEGVGSDFARGIVKGIGNIISGPGLAIAGAIIAKLTIDLARFGVGSLQTFFGLNKAAKEQAALQGQIASTLLNSKSVQEQIMAIENSTLTVEQKRLAQTRFFTTALNEQMAIMTRMQGIAAGVAPGVMRGTRGARGKAAGGYIPNFNATMGYGSEQADINRGVGGAPKGARPVTMPNFNFGGGQRGTMIANDSEFVVDNFRGSGGSAIFNQKMASSMGLPAGARKIGAAGGYVPNFARTGGTTPLSERAAAQATGTGGKKFAAGTGVGLGRYNLGGKNFVLLTGTRGADYPNTKVWVRDKSAAKGDELFSTTLMKDATGVVDVPSFNIPPKGESTSMYDNVTGIEGIKKKLSKKATTMALDNARILSDGQMPKPKKREFIEQKFNPGTLTGMAGSLFEVSLAALMSGHKFDDYVATHGNSIIDLFPSDRLYKVFRVPKGMGKTGAEVKGSFTPDLIAGAAKKFYELDSTKKKYADLTPFKFAAGAMQGKVIGAKGIAHLRLAGHGGKWTKNTTYDQLNPAQREIIQRHGRVEATHGTIVYPRGAHGYIPNYADPLREAIGRERNAGLPLNQIRVNQDARLRNVANPRGLAVTNTRDEPTGRVPNFAKPPAAGGGDAMSQASSDLMMKFMMLTMAASMLSGIFSEVGEETSNFSTGMNKATQAVMMMAMVGMLGGAAGGFGMMPAGGLMRSGRATSMAGGAMLAQGKEKARLMKPGARTDMMVGRAGKVAGGAMKVGSIFGRILPVVGQVTFAFMALNGVLTMFGKEDVLDPIKNAFKKIGMAIGLVDTPAVKAAKALDKLTDAAYQAAAEKGGFTPDSAKKMMEDMRSAMAEVRAKASLEGDKGAEKDIKEGKAARGVLLERKMEARSVREALPYVREQVGFKFSMGNMLKWDEKGENKTWEPQMLSIPQSAGPKEIRDMITAEQARLSKLDVKNADGSGQMFQKRQGEATPQESADSRLLTLTANIHHGKDGIQEQLKMVDKLMSGDVSDTDLFEGMEKLRKKGNITGLPSAGFVEELGAARQVAYGAFAKPEGAAMLAAALGPEGSPEDIEAALDKIEEGFSEEQTSKARQFYAEIIKGMGFSKEMQEEINALQEKGRIQRETGVKVDKIQAELAKNRISHMVEIQKIQSQMVNSTELEKQGKLSLLNISAKERGVIKEDLRMAEQKRKIIGEQISLAATVVQSESSFAFKMKAKGVTEDIPLKDYKAVQIIVGETLEDIKREGGWNKVIKADLMSRIALETGNATLAEHVADLLAEQAEHVRKKALLEELSSKRVTFQKTLDESRLKTQKRTLEILKAQLSVSDSLSKNSIAQARIDLKIADLQGQKVGAGRGRGMELDKQIAEQRTRQARLTKRASMMSAREGVRKELFGRAEQGGLDLNQLSAIQGALKEAMNVEQFKKIASDIEAMSKKQEIDAIKKATKEKIAILDKIHLEKLGADYVYNALVEGGKSLYTAFSVVEGIMATQTQRDIRKLQGEMKPTFESGPWAVGTPEQQKRMKELQAQNAEYKERGALRIKIEKNRSDRQAEAKAAYEKEYKTERANAEAMGLQDQKDVMRRGPAPTPETDELANTLKLARLRMKKEIKDIANALAEGADYLNTFEKQVVDFVFNLAQGAEDLKFQGFGVTSAGDILQNVRDKEENTRLQALAGQGLTAQEYAQQGIAAGAEKRAIQGLEDQAFLSSTAAESRSYLRQIPVLNEIFALKAEMNATGDHSVENQQKLLELEKKRLGVNDSLSKKLENAFVFTQEEIQNNLTTKLVDGAKQFAKTMSDGLVDSIAKGESLGDTLRSAATDFFTTMAKAHMEAAFNQLTSGLFGGLLGDKKGGDDIKWFHHGGVVTGGSGGRDDIPTLLEDGEFVVRRDAVKKYGARFLEDLNRGNIGQMQRGGLFTPGTYGQGAIKGKGNLLDFATQSFTGGQFDQISEGDGFGSASLEPQSAALTMFGRRNSPLFQREQQSKQEAFGLYTRQIQYEEQIKEQNKEAKKAFWGSVMSAVASVGINQFMKGFSESMKDTKGGEKGPLSRLFSATGAGIKGFGFEGERHGGILNWTGGGGKLPSITRAERAKSMQLADAGRPIPRALPVGEFSGGAGIGLPSGGDRGGNRNIAGFLQGIIAGFTDIIDGFTDIFGGPGVLPPRGALGGIYKGGRGGSNNFIPGYATGGSVDGIPARLSDGEFVMNAAATQRMGRGNLAALNSGGGGEGGDNAIVAAINNLGDELGGRGETVINITVNSDGTQTQDTNGGGEENQNLAARLGDSVRQIIAEEQRLGGSLRRV